MKKNWFKKILIVFLGGFIICYILKIFCPFVFLHPSFGLKDTWDVKEPENTPFTNERIIKNSISHGIYMVEYTRFLDPDFYYYLVADFNDDVFIKSELKRSENIAKKYKKWSDEYDMVNFIGEDDMGGKIDYKNFNLEYNPEKYCGKFSFSFCPKFWIKEKMFCPVYIYYSHNQRPYFKWIRIVKISPNKWRLFVEMKVPSL